MEDVEVKVSRSGGISVLWRDLLKIDGIRLIGGIVFGLIVITWQANEAWNGLQDKMSLMISHQTELQQSISDEDKTMKERIENNSTDLHLQLDNISNRGIRERQILSDRVTKLEDFVDDQNKKDSARENEIAQVSQQTASIQTGLNDIKMLIQTFLTQERPSSVGARR